MSIRNKKSSGKQSPKSSVYTNTQRNSRTLKSQNSSNPALPLGPQNATREVKNDNMLHQSLILYFELVELHSCRTETSELGSFPCPGFRLPEADINVVANLFTSQLLRPSFSDWLWWPNAFTFLTTSALSCPFDAVFWLMGVSFSAVVINFSVFYVLTYRNCRTIFLYFLSSVLKSLSLMLASDSSSLVSVNSQNILFHFFLQTFNYFNICSQACPNYSYALVIYAILHAFSIVSLYSCCFSSFTLAYLFFDYYLSSSISFMAFFLVSSISLFFNTNSLSQYIFVSSQAICTLLSPSSYILIIYFQVFSICLSRSSICSMKPLIFFQNSSLSYFNFYDQILDSYAFSFSESSLSFRFFNISLLEDTFSFKSFTQQMSFLISSSFQLIIPLFFISSIYKFETFYLKLAQILWEFFSSQEILLIASNLYDSN